MPTAMRPANIYVATELKRFLESHSEEIHRVELQPKRRRGQSTVSHPVLSRQRNRGMGCVYVFYKDAQGDSRLKVMPTRKMEDLHAFESFLDSILGGAGENPGWCDRNQVRYEHRQTATDRRQADAKASIAERVLMILADKLAPTPEGGILKTIQWALSIKDGPQAASAAEILARMIDQRIDAAQTASQQLQEKSTEMERLLTGLKHLETVLYAFNPYPAAEDDIEQLMLAIYGGETVVIESTATTWWQKATVKAQLVAA